MDGIKEGLRRGKVNGQSFAEVLAIGHTLDTILTEYVVCGSTKGNGQAELDENFQQKHYLSKVLENLDFVETCICGKRDLRENVYLTCYDPSSSTGTNKDYPILAIGNHCQKHFWTLEARRSEHINQQNKEANETQACKITRRECVEPAVSHKRRKANQVEQEEKEEPRRTKSRLAKRQVKYFDESEDEEDDSEDEDYEEEASDSEKEELDDEPLWLVEEEEEEPPLPEKQEPEETTIQPTPAATQVPQEVDSVSPRDTEREISRMQHKVAKYYRKLGKYHERLAVLQKERNERERETERVKKTIN